MTAFLFTLYVLFCTATSSVCTYLFYNGHRGYHRDEEFYVFLAGTCIGSFLIAPGVVVVYGIIYGLIYLGKGLSILVDRATGTRE